MTDPLLWWGLGLFAGAFFVLFLEVFIPSAGLLGLLAAGLAIAGVVCFWIVSPAWGASSLLALLVLAPLAIAFMFKIWPDTYVGRRIILSSGGSDEDDPDAAEATPAPAPLRALVGAEGAALSDLRPVGSVRINGERHEAQSEHGLIESGSRVRVTGVVDNRIRVREITKNV